MPETQLERGIAQIKAAIDAALRDLSVTDVLVVVNQDDPPNVTFTLSQGQKRQSHTFLPQEVQDSALAIDAPASMHVRMLVAPFVR